MTISPERDGWSVLSFPYWHQWPAGGSARALGPSRRRWKSFVDGQTYTKRQIAGWVWGDTRSMRRAWAALPESARFRCDEQGACYRFSLLVPHDPMMPAADAYELMQKLQAKGFTIRQVARETGISPDTAARAAQGVGQVRLSTVRLLDELAGSLNGGRR